MISIMMPVAKRMKEDGSGTTLAKPT